MFKKLAITTTIGLSSLGTFAHYASHAYVSIESKIINKIESSYVNTLEGLAKDYGFVRPPTKLETKNRLELLKHYCKDIGKVPYSLARAVMAHESLDDKYAESSAGAIGLMQVMPSNYKICGLENENQLWEEEANIKCGCQILSSAYKNHKIKIGSHTLPNILKILKEYNAGFKNIDNSEENRNYPYFILSKLE